jgi:glycerol-3-phosphate cytidylyltransferase
MTTLKPLEIIEIERKNGKKIGYVCSSFDCLHAGHVAMLAESKANCDFLVAGLLSDPTIDRPTTKNKPVQSMFERWVQLQAISYIDLVFPFESEQDLYDSLLVIRPDIRFVGEEYKGLNFNGSDLTDIEIYFNKRRHSFSTTELRERIINFTASEMKPVLNRQMEFPEKK